MIGRFVNRSVGAINDAIRAGAHAHAGQKRGLAKRTIGRPAMTTFARSLLCLVGVTLIGAGCCSESFTVRVVEIKCADTRDASGKCPTVPTSGAKLKFTVNPSTRAMALLVVDAANDWSVAHVIYDSCTVVDENNWTCGNSSEESIGVANGAYHRRWGNSTISSIGYDVHGVIGWRYWNAQIDPGFKVPRE